VLYCSQEKDLPQSNVLQRGGNTPEETPSRELYFSLEAELSREKCSKVVLLSVVEPEPHLLVGAGAVMRCGLGSGSDGSGSDNGIKHG
jgi:hypothetical protein